MNTTDNTDLIARLRECAFDCQECGLQEEEAYAAASALEAADARIAELERERDEAKAAYSRHAIKVTEAQRDSLQERVKVLEERLMCKGEHEPHYCPKCDNSLWVDSLHGSIGERT